MIDQNDLQYIEKMGYRVLMVKAAPIVEGKVNPQCSRFLVIREGKVEVADVFHVKPVYYETVEKQWRPLSEISSWYGNKKIILNENWNSTMSLYYLKWLMKRMSIIGGKVFIPTPKDYLPLSFTSRAGFAHIEFSTLTAYPDPNPETTTVDGEVNVDEITNSGVWATVRDKTTADHSDDSGVQTNFWRAEFLSGRYVIGRIFTLFDTSSLTSVATITAATISIFALSAGGDTSAAVSSTVVSSNPTSNTAISTSDYDRSTHWGATRYCDTDVPNSSTKNQYLNWAFNATGIAAISKTSVTKLGFRTANDVDNSAPGARSYWPVSMADQTGTTNDPKFVVTYTVSTFWPQALFI